MVTAFRAARATHGNSGPTTTTVWLPNFVEIGCHFKIIAILHLRRFGLKIAIHTPNGGFGGLGPFNIE